MANTDNVAIAYGAVFRERFYQTNVWRSLVRDRTPELSPGADRIRIPVYARARNAQALTLSQQLGTSASELARNAPQIATTSYIDLVADKPYEVDTLVGTFADVLIRAPLLAEVADLDARAFTEQVNEDIRAKFDLAASAQQLTAVTTTSANWGNAAHQTKVEEAIRSAAVKADYAHWPRDGRYVVVSPAVGDVISVKVRADKNFLISGITDNALRENLVDKVFSFNVYIDDSLTEGTTSSSDANHSMYFGRMGSGISFVEVIRNLRTIVSEVYRGYRVMGDAMWGALITNPTHVLIAKHNIT